MGAVADAVTSAVSSVGDAVGDVTSGIPDSVISAVNNLAQGFGGSGGLGGIIDSVSNVASSVIDNVVAPVAKAVDNTIQAAVNDPIGTAAKVTAMVVAPELLPVVNAVDSLANGASLDQVLKSSLTSTVANEFTPIVAPEVAQATDSQIIGNLAQAATKGAINAGLSGKDILTGSTAGALTSGVNQGIAGLSDVLKTEDTTPIYPQAADVTPPPPADVTPPEPQDLTPPAPAEVTPPAPAEVTPPAPEDVTPPAPLSDVTEPTPVSEPVTGGLPVEAPATTEDQQPYGYTYDAITGQVTPVSTPEEVMAANAGETPSAYTYNPQTGALVPAYTTGDICAANAATLGCYNAPAPITSCTTGTKIAQQLLTPSIVGSIMGTGAKTGAQPAPRTAAQKRAIAQAFGPGCSTIPWLNTEAQMLAGILPNEEEMPTGGLSGLGGAVPETKVPTLGAPHFAGITPELASVIQDRGINLAQGGSVPHFACGSSASFCSAMNYMNQFTPKFYPVKCNMLTSPAVKRNPVALTALKQLQSHIAAGGNMGGMAKGGLPAKYEAAKPDGHNPEFITGLTGYYACGGGTGQSDDIDAMLHDGDYVIDAEAVSAFGDGSSKAGKEVLMNFMHHIPHQKHNDGKPVPAKIADGEVVLPESFVTALGGGDNKRGAKMLDEMRQRLRDHKRSAPDTKIPPKAKSPLEYLKGAKG